MAFTKDNDTFDALEILNKIKQDVNSLIVLFDNNKSTNSTNNTNSNTSTDIVVNVPNLKQKIKKIHFDKIKKFLINKKNSNKKETVKQEIKYLTLFAFSTENWSRPKYEVNYLFNLLEKFLSKKIEVFHKKNIKLKIIGNKNFSKKLNKLLSFSEKKT